MKRIIHIGAALMLIVGMCLAASEIVANLTLKVTKSSVVYLNESVANALTLNAAVPNVSQYTLTVTTNTAGTAFVLGNVLTNGVCWLQNCDTNWVDIGVAPASTFYPLIRLKPGEAWPLRITPGITPYARSTVTNVVIKSIIIDD